MARPGGFPVTNPKSDYETNPIGPLFSTKAKNETKIPAGGDGPEARSAPPMGLCSRGWPHAGTPRTTQRNVTECYAENGYLLQAPGAGDRKSTRPKRLAAAPQGLISAPNRLRTRSANY